MVNRVCLVGGIATDVGLYYHHGTPKATFRLAVRRTPPRSADEPEADFIDIVAWGQNAEFAGNNLRRGHILAIEGRLQVHTFQTETGPRQLVEVLAEKLTWVDRPRDSREETP